MKIFRVFCVFFRRYTRLLRLARTTDLSSIAATNALYVCGQDHDGSPVVVLVAKYMNIPNLDLDKVCDLTSQKVYNNNNKF